MIDPNQNYPDGMVPGEEGEPEPEKPGCIWCGETDKHTCSSDDK